jgi:hypothetical protein
MAVTAVVVGALAVLYVMLLRGSVSRRKDLFNAVLRSDQFIARSEREDGLDAVHCTDAAGCREISTAILSASPCEPEDRILTYIVEFYRGRERKAIFRTEGGVFAFGGHWYRDDSGTLQRLVDDQLKSGE